MKVVGGEDNEDESHFKYSLHPRRDRLLLLCLDRQNKEDSSLIMYIFCVY